MKPELIIIGLLAGVASPLLFKWTASDRKFLHGIIAMLWFGGTGLVIFGVGAERGSGIEPFFLCVFGMIALYSLVWKVHTKIRGDEPRIIRTAGDSGYAYYEPDPPRRNPKIRDRIRNAFRK